MITNILFQRISVFDFELILVCSPEKISHLCDHLQSLTKENQGSFLPDLQGIRVQIPGASLYELFLKLKHLNLLNTHITIGFVLNQLIELLKQQEQVKTLGNIQKFLSYYLPHEDIKTHIGILQQLLSSPLGLEVLSHLLDNGFQIIDTDELLPPVLKLLEQVGPSLACYPEAKQKLTHKYNQLCPLFESVQAVVREVVTLKTEQEIAQFFNRSFMLCYIQHYLFAGEEKNDRIHSLQEDYIINLIRINKLSEAKKYYRIARLSGFSYSSEDNLSKFSVINSDDHTANKSIFEFMLARYELSSLNIIFIYKYIAVQVINRLLEKEFSCDENEVKLLLLHYYSLCSEARPLPQALILEHTLHAIVQLASIIAPRIGKTQNLKTFIQLAHQLKPCLSVVSLKNRSNDALMKMEHYKINYISPFAHSDSSAYHAALQDLYECMLNSENFENFFDYLNTELSHSLSHLPPLQKDYQENQIKLLDLIFPNGKIFSWWCNLSEAQRTLKQAMHLLLLNLERSEGYNLPDAEGTDGVPRFYGFIPRHSANSLLTKQKRIFKESAYSSPGVIHGVEAHRLQLAALRFFIKQGILNLPIGKNVHDLLTYIVDNNLWNTFFDNRYSHFSSPYYLMSYLRSNSKYETLQKYAVFAFLKGMSKFIHIDCPLYDYEHLILMLSAMDNNFINTSDVEPFKNWLSANEHKSILYQEKALWSACYFKKLKEVQKCSTPITAIINHVND